MADDGFLGTYAPLANDIATRTGIDPAVVLGIIDTETGRGKHVLGNNIFGISPGGRVAQYPDVQTASEAFVSLMQTPRYAGVAQGTTPAAQASALVRGGYNTVNPNYAGQVGSKATAFGKQLGYQAPAAPAAPSGPTAPAGAPAGSAEEQLTRELGSTAPPQTPATGTAPTAAASGPAPGSAEEQLVRELKPTTTAKPAAPPQDSGPVVVDDMGRVVSGPGSVAPSGGDLGAQAAEAKRGITAFGQLQDQDVRNALAPAPNTTYGEVLPYATDDKTGEVRWALPNALRGMAQGIYDMTQGPATGGMTPEATQTLAGIMVGRGPEPGYRFSTVNRNLPPGSSALGRTEIPNWSPFLQREPPNPLADVKPVTPEVTARAEARPAGPTSEVAPAPAEPTAGGPSPGMGGSRPPLPPEDAQWVAGAKSRIDELNEANRAAGVPGSVGAAATPEELAKLTPQQMKAYRRQAELGEIIAPPERGVDKNIYVDGSKPTEAEWSGDPDVSQRERLYRERAPKEYDPRLNASNQARVNAYESRMGSDPQIVDLKEQKGHAAERDGKAFVRAAGPIDLQPTLGWLDEQLANPRIAEQPDIVKHLQEMRSSLFDAEGNLKTDPLSGWGIHDANMTRLEKAKLDTKSEKYATSQILDFKRLVDDANNKASNGVFQTFLDNQARFAQQINEMEVLGKFRTRLTNKDGQILPTAFHKFVSDLAIRRGRAGVDPAMDITDETMRTLINIDKDLKRAGNIDLGSSRGSHTNLMGALAESLGMGAAHLGSLALTGGNPVGNFVVQGGINRAKAGMGNWMLGRAVRRGLAEPPGGYNYNALQPPD